MKGPVIEVSECSVTVMPAFDGRIEGALARRRSNLAGNPVRYVIDSEGDLTSFEYIGTNHTGLRALVSKVLWNISTDTFQVARRPATVNDVRQVLGPFAKSESADDRELAAALLEPLNRIPPDSQLKPHVALLNL